MNIEWNEYINKVSDYIGKDPGQINENTNIYGDLGLDSLGIFSLGMYLVKEFKVKISLNSIAAIETIGDIYRLLINAE